MFNDRFFAGVDVVDHPVLLAKLSKLDLPESIQNWIVSFLAGRSQSVKLDCSFSSQQLINRGIVIWCGTYAVHCNGR